MPLYKFIERKYLDSFFLNGELRLGTIHGYRDTGEYGPIRGDVSEGRHSVMRQIDKPLTVTDNSEPIVSEMFKVEGSGSVTFSNVSFVVQRHSPDAFIFCTSHDYSELLFLEWHKQENLDACYEIINVPSFVAAITKKIEASAWYAATSRVIYRGEHIDYQSRHANAPGITKAQEYAWQLEVRSIWPPLLPSPPLRPWIIEVPDATKFCRPFAVIEKSAILYQK